MHKSALRIDILTIFPGMFKPVLGESIIKRAVEKGAVRIGVHNLRDFAEDKHRKVDDRPFGGGPGMVLKAGPIYRAVGSLKSRIENRKSRVILLSPRGRRLDQKLARRFSKYKHLILICGHYEGVDERVKKIVTDEVSIGDYVLTGGELPAMVVVDSVVRLLPGALGDSDSAAEESFSGGLLEYPHYTRPREFMDMKVPAALLSGDHRAIEVWRRGMSFARTKKTRPDLVK